MELTAEEFVAHLKENNIWPKINKRALRYFVAEKILPTPVKIGGNRAYYTEEHLTQMKRFRRLKEAKYKNADIKKLMTPPELSRPLTNDELINIDTVMIERFIKHVKRLADYFLGSPQEKKLNRSVFDLEKLREIISSYPRREIFDQEYCRFLLQSAKCLGGLDCVLPGKTGWSAWIETQLEQLYEAREKGFDVQKKFVALQYSEKSQIKETLLSMLRKHISALEKAYRALEQL